MRVPTPPVSDGTGRLEFAAFPVKSMTMTSGGGGIFGFRRSVGLWLARAVVPIAIQIAPASAQMFSDHPPPVPPAAVPDVPSGPALNLAPPSGPAAGPPLTAPLAQPSPSIATVPPTAVAPPGAASPGQAVLSLTARYGKDLAVINSGLVWRIFPDRPDETGTFKLIREERGATPNIVLPPGNYVVHVAFGLVSAVRAVSLKAETDRESFLLPAGGLRIEGRVGSSKIPQNQISFAIYKGSQFEGGDRAPLVPSVPAGDVALLAEGTHYIISNYVDANSVVRPDSRVPALQRRQRRRRRGRGDRALALKSRDDVGKRRARAVFAGLRRRADMDKAGKLFLRPQSQPVEHVAVEREPAGQPARAIAERARG